MTTPVLWNNVAVPNFKTLKNLSCQENFWDKQLLWEYSILLNSILVYLCSFLTLGNVN